MKKTKLFLFNLLLSLIFQTHIQVNNECNLKQIVNHDYDEISHLTINYKNIFEQIGKQYFIYFYSLTCGHCFELKNEIITYALCNKIKTYFVLECDEIKYGFDTNLTIGISNIESLFIKGYPTLIEINNNVLTFNEAGKNKIIEKLFAN